MGAPLPRRTAVPQHRRHQTRTLPSVRATIIDLFLSGEPSGLTFPKQWCARRESNLEKACLIASAKVDLDRVKIDENDSSRFWLLTPFPTQNDPFLCGFYGKKIEFSHPMRVKKDNVDRVFRALVPSVRGGDSPRTGPSPLKAGGISATFRTHFPHRFPTSGGSTKNCCGKGLSRPITALLRVSSDDTLKF